MSQQHLETTRRSLHGIAELVLAGPQYDTCQSIRLQVTPGGFGTVADPDLRVDGLDLVSPTARLPLGGTFARLARAAGVEARALRDVYADGPAAPPRTRWWSTPTPPWWSWTRSPAVTPPCAHSPRTSSRCSGPSTSMSGSHSPRSTTVSPRRRPRAEPSAYVGPWAKREGAFWNQDFGAMRLLREIPDVDSLVAFFHDGATRAAADPENAT